MLDLRQFQQDIEDAGSRFTVACIHRRAGKTAYALNWLVEGARIEPRPNQPAYRGFYVCPYRNQAKSVAWDMLRDQLAGEDIKWSVADLYAQFPNGARIQLLGADRHDAHRGKYASRVAFDETGQIAPAAWRSVFRPMLADSKGSALFIGTPYGRNFFKHLYDLAEELPDWSRHMATALDTGIIDADELASLEGEMSRSEFAREFMCNWNIGAPGAYFGEEMDIAESDGRQSAGPLFDPEEPVHTGIALCSGDCIAVTFWQMRGKVPVLIDSQRWLQTRIDQVARDLKAKPYVYGKHAFAQQNGRRFSHTTSAAPFRMMAMRKHGIRGPEVTRLPEFVDEVQVTKLMLARTEFSTDAGLDAVDALRQCAADWSEELQSFSNAPRDDWALDLTVSVYAFAAQERRGALGSRKPITYPERFRA